MRFHPFAPVALAFALSSLAACSAGDGPVVITRRPSPAEQQTGAGAATTTLPSPTPQPSPTGSPAQPPPNGQPTPFDAGSSWSPPLTLDAGTSGAGSCTTPVCVTDGKKCGCTATDSQGDAVLLGCAEGACGCFVGTQEELVGSAFAEDATCLSSAEAAYAFVLYCACK